MGWLTSHAASKRPGLVMRSLWGVLHSA